MPSSRHSARRAGLKKQADGDISVELAADVSYGELHPADLVANRPTVLHSAMVTKTELKFREAEYFLRQVNANLHNECAVHYYLSAFLTSLRAVTFVIQKECSNVPAFKDWYSSIQEQMRSDRELRTLVELRNSNEKEGIEPPNARFVAIQQLHLDGTKRTILTVETITIHGTTFDQPLDVLQKGLEFMRLLVLDAKNKDILRVPENARRGIDVGVRTQVQRKDGTWETLPPPKGLYVDIVGVEEREHRPDLH